MDIAPCPADHSRHGPSSGGACYMARPTDFEPETASNSLGQGRYGCLGGSSMFGQKAKEVWKHRCIDALVIWDIWVHCIPSLGLSKPWPMPIWPFFGLHLIRTLLWLHTLSPSCGKSRADNLYLPAVTTCLSRSQLPGIPVANHRLMSYHWTSLGKWCSLQLAPFCSGFPAIFVVGLSLNLVFWTPGITKALRAWLFWSEVERSMRFSHS